MEDYIFSSSNSESSSSCASDNFPFSLYHHITNNSNAFDADHCEPLMSPIMEIPTMVQSPLNNDDSYLDDHHHDDDDHINNRMMKRGSSSSAAENKKIRKHRYAFQTRSQVDILDDGYRWRKYGQKAVKNNTFPRGYYKCTYQGCNVKKQVQRLSNDEGVVVTTYEGIHSHPIEKSTDNFEHILSRMQIYPSF